MYKLILRTLRLGDVAYTVCLVSFARDLFFAFFGSQEPFEIFVVHAQSELAIRHSTSNYLAVLTTTEACQRVYP